MKGISLIGFIALTILLSSCEKEPRNILGNTTEIIPPQPSAEVNPIDISESGFDLLENMQGQWVGINRVIADDYPWFAFDYRAISPSQIQGIFEGGSQGNLQTSFFVTNFKGKKTIMARNGGLLNGIYRTSYFVLDSVGYGQDDAYYRLVDAEGGARTMSMELRFVQDSLYWNAYTSRLGLNAIASRHMTFKAIRNDFSLAHEAANTVGFPTDEVLVDFADGFMEEYLYAEEGAKSATFLSQSDTKDVFELAAESGDPYRLDQHPHLGFISLQIEKNNLIIDDDILMYLSKDPLVDNNGYFTSDLDAYNSILLFPYIVKNQNQFFATYIHPGSYYLTLVADKDGDLGPSEGDVTHLPLQITVEPESNLELEVKGINIQN